MSTPYLGEIKIVSFNFAPVGWLMCNGQLLPINQNQALFALLGITYGGNGTTTFAIPNLQARLAMHVGMGHVLGESGGAENHTLTLPELPQHTHNVIADSAPANAFRPAGALPADGAPNRLYSTTPSVTMNPAMITVTGGSQAHPNQQPYLVFNFVIAVAGIFPSRN